MEYQKVIQEIKRGQIQPLYFVYGSEQYLRQSFIDQLLNQLDDSTELDISRFDYDEVSMDLILDEAEMFSFFSDYRVIIVNQFELLTTTPNSKISDQEIKRLMAYIDDPNPATYLIFIQHQDKIDKRKKISKAFQKKVMQVDVTPLEEKEVKYFIQTYIKEANIDMTREALTELLQRVGYQLTQTMTELNKLATYAKSGQPITVQTVRALVPRTLESDVFELVNALIAKQVDKATQIYQDLLLLKNEPIALHALIVSQFRIIIQTKILAQNGFQAASIAEQLAIHPYRVQLALQTGKSMSLKSLSTFYQSLVKADLQMKTGEGPKEIHFYMLLIRLIQMA
ncbi:DNA polymerase III subunit delta [Fundicoccus culcitae]|uniref:DNA polymerase III subunit delta n=1 Tax=Fundicoccus culcitae TaxID=2969821 RepID=A0ABY5P5P6_9LACT|nr:DNA polymerase III subunit delta [Fundicoccus culcitae]UUX34067.1 DNA polymerase III subunit delta [Fundicoccus culcitae]